MSYSDSPPPHLDEAFNALFQSSDLTAYSSSYEPDFSRFVPPLNAAESPQNLASTPPISGGLDNLDDALPPKKETQTKRPPFIKEDQQVSRWRLKHIIANILRAKEDSETTPGVCKCGTAGHQVDEVHLVRRKGRAGVKGVFFCDSPWLCPSCAPRRAAERAKKVQRVFDAVERKKGQVVFMTLTVQHGRKDALSDLKQIVSESCRKARQSKSWTLGLRRYGIAGVMVGPEVTWSQKNGWHYHLHLAIPTLGIDEDKSAEAGEWLLERYRKYIQKAGGRAERKAQDVTVVWRKEDLVSYLSKGSAAWEVSSAGATKQGKSGQTPWDLAVRAGRGDAYAAQLFQEYAETMPGTRSCVITKPMAQKLGIDPAEDDDAPGIDEEIEEDTEIVGSMEPPRWHRVLRNGYAPDVLKVINDGWEWPAIDSLIAQMLKEDDWERTFQKNMARLKKEGPPGPRPLSVSSLELGQRSRSIQNRRAARTSIGAALQIAIQSYRDEAAQKNRPLILPCLKTTMGLLVDGVV